MPRKSKVIKSLHHGRSKLPIIKKIKKEKNPLPTRWSRRVRNLPPIGFKDTKLKLEDKRKNVSRRHSSKLSVQEIGYNKTSRQSVIAIKSSKQSVEVGNHVTNFTASLRKLRSSKRKSKGVQHSAAKMHLSIGRVNHPLRSIDKTETRQFYMLRKRTDKESVGKLGDSSRKPAPITKRKKYVLEVLNHGNIKDLGKLQAIGAKTAESIMLFRQFKGGTFRTISELTRMPAWHDSRQSLYKKFLALNYLPEED